MTAGSTRKGAAVPRAKTPARTTGTAAQRERVLAAMVEAVAERGYAAATVADVIGRAGIGRATFYELYPNKEECFLAAYDELIGIMVGRVSVAYNRAGSWPDRVIAALGALLRALAENPDSARVGIVEVIGAGPRAHERFRQGATLFVPFIDAGREAVPDGDAIPPRVARGVIGGIAIMIVDEINAGRTASLPRLLPELVYTALVSFLGHERAWDEMQRLSEDA